MVGDDIGSGSDKVKLPLSFLAEAPLWLGVLFAAARSRLLRRNR
jgi:hypothetical protein